jgi:DNA-binding NarL/FixJ family response regulator
MRVHATRKRFVVQKDKLPLLGREMPIDKGCPVLVADDDEYFRLAVTALLRGPLGFSDVIETGSLDEALEKLTAATPVVALALFDLFMPGMDGPTTLGAVRDCHPAVRIAVVSSSRSRQDILAALDVGVHGFIPKGCGPAELVRALEIIVNDDIFVPSFVADVSGIIRAKPSSQGEISGSLPSSMSRRQQDVLALLVKGYSNKKIANDLSLGEGTVKIHVATLLRKLGVSNRTGAAAAGAHYYKR